MVIVLLAISISVDHYI